MAHGQVLYVHDFHKQYDYTIVFCLFSQSVPWGWRAANLLVLKRAREALGFQQCKVFAVGAAPIKMETMEYFMSVNIPIMNVYGKEAKLQLSRVMYKCKLVLRLNFILPPCRILCR